MQRGAVAVQLLVLMVPVFFGLMGFAVDLGQLYVVRGEMQAAADAMALAAAKQLIGTDAATDTATTAARLTLDSTSGHGNRYYFGGFTIGQTNGPLNSDAPDPAYYAAVADATGTSSTGSGTVTGSQAKHVKVTLSGETQLTFWSFIPLATDRKANVAAQAIAGMSAPLCVGCSIEPIAVAAIDQSDTTDFGFALATKYTLGYSCNGAAPAALAGTAQRLPYLILNRLSSSATIFTDEQSQLFRVGANGLPGSTDFTYSCFTVGNPEQMWVTAAPAACTAARPAASVVSMVCGLTTRFETTAPATCANIPEVDTMNSIYLPDSDTSDVTDYTAYTGTGRRIITIAVVDALSATGDMTVLGFRQFLVDPIQGGVDIDPADRTGGFPALYIGSVAPLKQGSVSGCQQSAGPGKVVLHQ